MNDVSIFGPVLPNAMWLTRNLVQQNQCEIRSRVSPVHVVMAGTLHLCESEEQAIAILDSLAGGPGELSVYCHETQTLVIDGVGTVTGLADCRYHIWEILDEVAKSTNPAGPVSLTGDPVQKSQGS